MSAQPPLPTLTELKLTEQIKQIVNGALTRGRPMSFAYSDDKGEPNLSFRGAIQAFGDTQLSLWVRNPEGGLSKAIEKHPAVAALYGDLDPAGRAFLTFRGRGRIDSSESVRKAVYENAPQAEQNLDKERKGLALVIDLDTVHGMVPGSRVAMRR